MMQDNKVINGSRYGVSLDFKLAMVIILFFLIAAQLAFLYNRAFYNLVPDSLVLTVGLLITLYLWVVEVKSRHFLSNLNRDLEIAQERLKQDEIDIMTALVNILEQKDPYTGGHSERVTRVALAIADEMGLGSAAKLSISRAGILHDIGKVGISDAILHKKEELTEEEWHLIQNHPDMAVDILKPLKFLEKEMEIIRSHHERYDGKGYGSGLKCDEICQEAQILSVADSFDAMNSDRPYRGRLTRDEVVGELNKARDAQHSARVVDALFGVLRKRPELWNR
jgi:putative nucleotidyltransferase with HDIG domain